MSTKKNRLGLETESVFLSTLVLKLRLGTYFLEAKASDGPGSRSFQNSIPKRSSRRYTQV